jgi:hypothetical protein
MATAAAFAALILGFVPLIAVVAVVVTLVWGATKLFPTFGETFNNFFDRAFGVTEEKDDEYTDFVIHPSNYIRVPR